MYKTVIGLEIHVELNTKSKMFSSASVNSEAGFNQSVNVVDIALPGVLPTVNKESIKRAIKLALATNCSMPSHLYFDRKNYFYADLPKGYQITQQHEPIGKNGYILTDVNGEEKKVLIHDIHIEEDTANLEHTNDKTLIDYNRAGITLLEIVTEPCLSSYEEVFSFLETLRSILVYLNISQADVSKGQMRCDVNISLMKKTDTLLGVRSEIKNVSSMTGVKESIDFEIKRHTKLLENNEEIKRETRRYLESESKTVAMRKKEEDVDYKYFIEPNIPKLKIEESFVDSIRKELITLPYNRIQKYVKLGVLLKDAKALVKEKDVSDYYEECLFLEINPIMASNFVVMNILTYLNKENKKITEIYLKPKYLKDIIFLVENNKINSAQAKDLINKVNDLSKEPLELIKELNIKQITDPQEIRNLVNEVLNENESLLNTYKNGNKNIIGALVGKALQKSEGKANPKLTNEIMNEEILKK